MRNFLIFDRFCTKLHKMIIILTWSILQQNRPVSNFWKIFKFLEFSESRWSNDKPGLASKDTFAVKRGHYEVISLSRLFRIILFFKVSHSWLIFIARSTGSALELFFTNPVRVISYHWFCNTIIPKNRSGYIFFSTLPLTLSMNPGKKSETRDCHRAHSLERNQSSALHHYVYFPVLWIFFARFVMVPNSQIRVNLCPKKVLKRGIWIEYVC